MGLHFTGVLCLVVCLCSCVRLSAGSAWLQDPPSRSALWMYGIRARPNYDFRNLNCGGDPVQIQSNGSRNCGICGDTVSDPVPRPNENGGKYANPIIRTRYYESGSVAEISVRNNLARISGFYEFRLCTDGDNPTQECFNQNLLTITEVNNTNIDVPPQSGTNVFHVQLPAGVTCSRCMFQWRFRKEKSVAGCDNTNWCGLGRGPQIEFYNCADVIVGAVGQPKPTDPNVLQEPTYDAVDYGSAYDVATTLTTSGGVTPNNPGGTTTHDHTTRAPTTTTSRFNVITVPTASTSGTTASSGNQAPNAGRLVYDGNGNAFGDIITIGGSNSRTNNAPLLFLLGLLPILGAASLRDNKPLPVAPATPSGFWVQNPPMSEYYLGANLGFGNFGSNGMASFASSTGSGIKYGTYGKSYGTSIGYGGSGNNGYNGNQKVIGTAGLGTLPRLANADFTRTNIQLREMVQSNANVIGNVDSTKFGGGGITSSWNNKPFANQQITSHVFPRATGAQYQTHQSPYQPSPIFGSNTVSSPQYQPHNYNNNNFGQSSFPQRVPPVNHNIGWNGNNNINNNINNNNNNFNGVSPGQRLPVQQTVPRQPVSQSPAQRTPAENQPVDLPGIAPASRFVQSPRTITLTESSGQPPISDRSSNGRQLMAHDWYYQLLGNAPLADTLPQ